jgi:hypothetical protein
VGDFAKHGIKLLRAIVAVDSWHAKWLKFGKNFAGGSFPPANSVDIGRDEGLPVNRKYEYKGNSVYRKLTYHPKV